MLMVLRGKCLHASVATVVVVVVVASVAMPVVAIGFRRSRRSTPPASATRVPLLVVLPRLVEDFGVLRDLLGDGLNVVQLSHQVVVVNQLFVEVATAAASCHAAASCSAVGSCAAGCSSCGGCGAVATSGSG